MDADYTYDALKRELVESVGYAGRLEIPVTLVRKIAAFIDEYPDDSMTTYYTQSLLDQFYRKRTKERSIRLFELLSSLLKNKSSLIDLFLRPEGWQRHPVAHEHFDAATIWSAIRDLDDGNGKANYIGDYAHLFTDEVASQAYQAILEMSEPFKTRALGGIYPRMDTPRKAEIVTYLLQQFASGLSEAAYRLKFIFPFMDRASRTRVVAAHLDLPDVREGLIAYLVIATQLISNAMMRSGWRPGPGCSSRATTGTAACSNWLRTCLKARSKNCMSDSWWNSTRSRRVSH